MARRDHRTPRPATGRSRRGRASGRGNGPETARRRPSGASVLLTPGRRLRWTDEERRWRSVVLDGRGAAISVGLPKFFDHDDPFAAPDLAALDRHGTGAITTKLDGRLLIRSVRAGRVWWRSRSSMGLEPELQAHLAAYERAHPRLVDPTWAPDVSLQCELLVPGMPIVIVGSGLWVIGASEHARVAPVAWERVERLAAEVGLPVPARVGPPEGAGDWQAHVDAVCVGAEGVVVRDADGWPRARVKTTDYQRRYRLRYLTPPQLVARAYERDEGGDDGRGRTPVDVGRVLGRVDAHPDDAETIARWCEELAALPDDHRATARNRWARVEHDRLLVRHGGEAPSGGLT